MIYLIIKFIYKKYVKKEIYNQNIIQHSFSFLGKVDIGE